MNKKEEQKEFYLAPQVETTRLGFPLSLLKKFSGGTGNVEDLIDGNLDDLDWGFDGEEPEDWFN